MSNFITLENGEMEGIGTYREPIFASVGKNSGKWYCEFNLKEVGLSAMIGIATDKKSYNGGVYSWSSNGNIYDYSNIIEYGNEYSSHVGIAFDLYKSTIRFVLDGVLYEEIYIDSIKNKILEESLFYPAVSSGGSSGFAKAIANFGVEPFKYFSDELKDEGYLPYDLENAHPDNIPYNPNLYLFQCNKELMQPTLLKYNKLGDIDEIGLSKEVFDEYGIEEIQYILGDIDDSEAITPTREIGEKDLYEIEIGGYKYIDSLDIRK